MKNFRFQKNNKTKRSNSYWISRQVIAEANLDLNAGQHQLALNSGLPLYQEARRPSGSNHALSS
jgi:hypothetical protein